MMAGMAISCARRSAVLLLFSAATIVAQSPGSLTDTLSTISNKQLAAWQHHDKAAYLAVRDPAFMYVGPLGIIEPGHPVDNIMRCDVTAYELKKVQTVRVDANTAILIAEQHQDATCFGIKQPTIINITETYTQRSGQWRLLLHTEAPAISLPGPAHD